MAVDVALGLSCVLGFRLPINRVRACSCSQRVRNILSPAVAVIVLLFPECACESKDFSFSAISTNVGVSMLVMGMRMPYGNPG